VTLRSWVDDPAGPHLIESGRCRECAVWVTDPRPDLAEALDTALAEAAPVLAGPGLPSQGLEGHLHVAGNPRRSVAAGDFVQENGPERVDVKRSCSPASWPPRHPTASC
jgi:hypothetical protein